MNERIIEGGMNGCTEFCLEPIIVVVMVNSTNQYDIDEGPPFCLR